MIKQNEFPVLRFKKEFYDFIISNLQKLADRLRVVLNQWQLFSLGDLKEEDFAPLLQSPDKYYLQKQFGGKQLEVAGVAISVEQAAEMVPKPANYQAFIDACTRVQQMINSFKAHESYLLPKDVSQVADFFAMDGSDVLLKEEQASKIKAYHTIQPQSEQAKAMAGFYYAVKEAAESFGLVEYAQKRHLHFHQLFSMLLKNREESGTNEFPGMNDALIEQLNR